MFRCFSLCLSFIISFGILNADPGGKTNSLLTSSGGCGGCHGGRSSNTSVSILSKSNSFTVQPGAKTEFTAIVAHPSKSGAGINIGVKSSPSSNTNSGTLEVIAGQGLKKSSSELTHTAPKSMSNGKAEFNFTWTAPMQEGVYYLMATGNAVNRNGGDSGDEWNFMTPIELTVTASTSIDEIAEVQPISVYPNPVLDFSIFQYSLLKASNVWYTVSNVMGQTIFTRDLGYKEAGMHSIHLLGLYSLLSSGNYIMTIHTPERNQSIPFIKQ